VPEAEKSQTNGLPSFNNTPPPSVPFQSMMV
jgi:hypothetical protein